VRGGRDGVVSMDPIVKTVQELTTGLVVRTTPADVRIVESDGKRLRLVQTIALLVLPSTFLFVVGYVLYRHGLSKEMFIATVAFGAALSVGLSFFAWKSLPVLHQPREIIVWNRRGELVRLWGEPVELSACRLVRSRTAVHDTISGHGVYAFVYECECVKDGQAEVIELFWSHLPCGWKLKRAGKVLGFPVHGL